MQPLDISSLTIAHELQDGPREFGNCLVSDVVGWTNHAVAMVNGNQNDMAEISADAIDRFPELVQVNMTDTNSFVLGTWAVFYGDYDESGYQLGVYVRRRVVRTQVEGDGQTESTLLFEGETVILTLDELTALADQTTVKAC